MSKPLSYSAWKSSATCRRCGNRIQSHDRCCDLCGAFNFAEISYQRGPENTEDRLSRGNVNVQLPLDLKPGALPPDFHKYKASSYSSPQPFRQRTLSLKAALLLACAVGLLAGGLTYLRFGTSSLENEPAYDTRPAVATTMHTEEVDARPDEPANVAYMSPKALHEIQNMLDDKHVSGSQAASTMQEENPLEATFVPSPNRTASPSTSGSHAPNVPAVRHASPLTSQADAQQQATKALAFSDSRDPDALELAIKQYGWKADAHAGKQ